MEVSQKFKGSVNEILSDINLDEDLNTLKLLGLKKHKSLGIDGLLPCRPILLELALIIAVPLYLIYLNHDRTVQFHMNEKMRM